MKNVDIIKKTPYLILAFIIFTIIGTITHEFGHILVAESLGYTTTLHYGSMNYNTSSKTKKLDSIYLENKYEIDHDIDFAEKKVFDKELKRFMSDSFKITLGGPIQTILTGSLGLAFLIRRRKKIRNNEIKLIDWLAVFLSLFWLREVFNIVHSISFKILFQDHSYFGGDEKYISEYLEIYPGTVPIILGLIGLAASIFVIFGVLPKRIQFPFIISGFIGGIIGFILWFQFLGPIIIP